MTHTAFTTVSGRVVDMLRPRAADIDFDDVAEHLAKVARYNGGTPGAFYSVAQHVVLGAKWLAANSSLPPCGQEMERGEICSGCGRLVSVYLTCDEDLDRLWCEGCFAKHSCPVEHGEGCATKVFVDAPPRSPALPRQGGGDARLLAAYFLAHDFHEYVLQDEVTPKKRALDAIAAEFGAASGLIRESFARLTERWDAALHAAAGLAWPLPPAIAAAVADLDRRMLVTEWAALHGGHPLVGCEDVAPLPIAIEPWGWRTAQLALRASMQRLLPCFR